MAKLSKTTLASLFETGDFPDGQDFYDFIDTVGYEYTHNQIAASASWVISHGLEKYPSVTVVDSGGSVVIGEITYNSENQITLTFQSQFSGKAYLN